MEVIKFKDFLSENKHIKPESLLDIIGDLVSKIEKGYKFESCATSVFCFGNGESSILVFDQDAYPEIQGKKESIRNLGGYNFYKEKKITNPFFNTGEYLESCFVFDGEDYFEKIKYFISKILAAATELGHYPSINWDSDKMVQVKIYTHKTGSVTEKDVELSRKISAVWNNI